VPFCVSLCPYCDFVVVTGRATRGPTSRIAAFLTALLAEIGLRADATAAQHAGPGPLHTVYVGGGTPSLVGARGVGDLLDAVAASFGISDGAEITLEVNPGHDERGDAAGFRAAGVTRLSIGAQSLQAHELRRLGRRHLPDDVADALRESRAAGISSVSVDLLTDVPGQTLDSWRSTLAAALALEPDHLSVYSLTLEDPDQDGLTGLAGDHLPVRPGARRWRERARSEQDPDLAADQDALTDELTAAAGLERYELSSHARPGHRSRHNLAYWRRHAVEAVGPGAHAFDGGAIRRWNAARLDGYLAALTPPDGSDRRLPPGGHEVLTPEQARSESVILGLRLADGVGSEVAQDPAFARTLTWAIDAGLADRCEDRVLLTPRGRLLSNEVFLRLLPDG
jgi:oxygen-independent coproporphyrinogen-3 oxidase